MQRKAFETTALYAPNFSTLINSFLRLSADFFHSSLSTFNMHGSPPLSFPFLCLFSSAGLMSITVALVDASLLSLRRASERTIKNGWGVIRGGTWPPRRRRRCRRRIALVLVSVAPVSHGIVVASRSVICSPEQKMFPVAAPSPASSLYTLFTP